MCCWCFPQNVLRLGCMYRFSQNVCTAKLMRFTQLLPYRTRKDFDLMATYCAVPQWIPEATPPPTVNSGSSRCQHLHILVHSREVWMIRTEERQKCDERKIAKSDGSLAVCDGRTRSFGNLDLKLCNSHLFIFSCT